MKKNILFILADQFRHNAIHALGNPVIRTPNLDTLVNQGRVFTQAYTPSPVCGPARCSLHYGRYPYQIKNYNNWSPYPEDSVPSYVGVLTKIGGYRTHAIGKVHFNPDPYAMKGYQSREFQDETPTDPQKDDYLRYLFSQGYKHIVDHHGVRGLTYYLPAQAQMPSHLHPTSWIGQQSVKFIKEQQDSGPWHLFASFIHPHPPLSVPAPWYRMYDYQQIDPPIIPANADELLTCVNRMQQELKFRHEGTGPWLQQGIKAYYYAAISFVDYQIGLLLRALEESKQRDSTVIIFSSDHGEYLGDYGCYGKRGMHNAVSKVPLILADPSLSAQRQDCGPVSLVDIAPTLLDIAGIEVQDVEGLTPSMPCNGLPLAGSSLLRCTDEALAKRTVYSQFSEGPLGIYMAADKDGKYIYSAGDQKEFFFHHRELPLEQTNQAGNPLWAAEKVRLRTALIEQLEAAEQTQAIQGGKWRPYTPEDFPLRPDVGPRVWQQAWADTTLPQGYNQS